MRFYLLASVIVSGLVLTLPSTAQEDETAKIREVWTRCEAIRSENPDDWIGWRRDFLNGYGDDFALWLFLEQPSVLVIGRMIDGKVFVTDTSCFRSDGTLAFIFSVMTEPDPEHGFIQREGRIYFDQTGKVIRVLGWVADPAGKKLGGLEDIRYQFSRDCLPVVLHPTIDQAELHYFSVLGEIDGTKPIYIEQELDWCSLAKEN